MARTRFSIATCNLYNLNQPGLRMYRDPNGWDEQAYDRKVRWLGSMARQLDVDVWGFQELWHRQALEAVFAQAGQTQGYRLLAPADQCGQGIVCAGAVREDLLNGEPEWIEQFPERLILESRGDDPQSPDIQVRIDRFSRPLLHFQIRPRAASAAISVYVAHLKSKRPSAVYNEPWYPGEDDYYKRHAEGLGAALSTIRRSAEAAALRMLIVDRIKGNDAPIIVLGDLNDGPGSNTLNILTGQPNYLRSPLSAGGSDTDLYSLGQLQALHSLRDVYYTHVHQDTQESLDHILVSQELYDQSRKRVWSFVGLRVINDHLDSEDHKTDGTTDHGIVRAELEYRPA